MCIGQCNTQACTDLLVFAVLVVVAWWVCTLYLGEVTATWKQTITTIPVKRFAKRRHIAIQLPWVVPCTLALADQIALTEITAVAFATFQPFWYWIPSAC